LHVGPCEDVDGVHVASDSNGRASFKTPCLL
jgi:hypothetical protein